jgi:hypothetical protein
MKFFWGVEDFRLIFQESYRSRSFWTDSTAKSTSASIFCAAQTEFSGRNTAGGRNDWSKFRTIHNGAALRRPAIGTCNPDDSLSITCPGDTVSRPCHASELQNVGTAEGLQDKHNSCNACSGEKSDHKHSVNNGRNSNVATVTQDGFLAPVQSSSFGRELRRPAATMQTSPSSPHLAGFSWITRRRHCNSGAQTQR